MAPRKVLGAIAITATTAAIVCPQEIVGIGVLLIGIVAIGAVLVGSPQRPSYGQLAMVAGIGALLAVPAWRSAEWLAGWCTALAIVATGVLIVGGRSIREMGLSMIAPIMLSTRAFGWVYRAVAARLSNKPVRNPGTVITVIGVTLTLVVAFGALFAGADATFAALLGDLTPDLGDIDLGGRVVFGAIAACATGIGCYLRHAQPRLAKRPPKPSGDTWTWAVPTGTVLALYVVFLITQARAMFGDDDYVVRTAGLTYADYARSGFWQLFAITALTIAVVSIGWQRAACATNSSGLLARIIFGGLCFAVMAVVVSAIYRMNLYMVAYGATRLRVSVMATELYFGGVVLILIAAGVGLHTRHLPRAIGALTIGAAIAFAAYNPDAQIARANVDRFSETAAADPGAGKIDVSYLAGLSPDATENLLRLPPEIRDCVLAAIADDVDTQRSWTEFNLGRAEAKDRLRGETIDLDESGRCPSR